MSDEDTKIKHSKRRMDNQKAIKKQVEIAKSHGIKVDEPHKLVKHHVLDDGVGDPEKYHGSKNPRKDFNELTIQEKRFYQSEEHNAYQGTDLSNTRDSN